GFDIILHNKTVGTGEEFIIWTIPNDNIGLSEVRAEYWFDEDITRVNMVHGNENNYEYRIEIPIDSIIPFNYKILLTDISGNSNSSEVFSASVIDIIPPSIEPISNQTVKVGEMVDITAIVDDNIGIERIVWFNNPVTPTTTQSQEKIIGIVEYSGTYQIVVDVYDEEGNSNSTTFYLFVEEVSKESSNLKDQTWLILLFIILLLVAVIIIISLVVVMKLNKKKEDESRLVEKGEFGRSTPQPPIQQPSAPDYPRLNAKDEPIRSQPSSKGTIGLIGPMPTAPSPVRTQLNYTPPKEKKSSTPFDRKQTLKGEFTPIPSNLLNPKRDD
ncbi:MAG: hypothetical protein KAH57_00805, partial [Thermoplasmata archaeon]|nr:hypothetical protein [Thermoplasmata archaeon]